MKTLLLILGLLVSQLSLADTFDCEALDSHDDLRVDIQNNKQMLVAVTKTDRPLTYSPVAYVSDFDKKYDRPANTARYIVRDSGVDETEIFISSQMLKGQFGLLRVEGKTENFSTRRYRCIPRERL